MNVGRFKVELCKLLRRFAPNNCDENSSPTAERLTTPQIVEAVREVLSSELDVNLVDSTSDQTTTPASGIVMTTPDAPDIPLLNAKHNGGFVGRIHTFETLWPKTPTDQSFDKPIIAEPGSLAAKADDDGVNVTAIDVPDTRVTDRKVMPKSSSKAKRLIRTGTFVHEISAVCSENGDTFGDRTFEVHANDGGTVDYSMRGLTEIMKKLEILRDSATDVVKKIDDIHKDESNNQPIRRLSSGGCAPGLHRTSTKGRTIQRPKMMCRSMLAALPGTPTSSRLSPEDSKAKDVSVTRKNTSTIPVANIEGSKLSIPATARSVSSGALTLSRKSVTRYDSPNHGSQAPDVNTQQKPSLQSPSLFTMNHMNRKASQQSKNRQKPQVSIPKEIIALGKRKAY